jgi:hypothetical protein
LHFFALLFPWNFPHKNDGFPRFLPPIFISLFQAVSSVPGLARRECALQLCLKLLEFGLITEFGIELCCPNKKVGGILMMLSVVKNPYHWDFYVISCGKSLSLGF